MLVLRNGLLLGTCIEGGAGAAGGAGCAAGGAGAAAAGAAGAAGGAAASNGAWTFPADKPFAEYLPEKYKADPSFVDIKNFDGLLSQFVNGKKMLGADKATILQMPKEGDQAGWNDFFAKLGRPEAADKYKVPPRADGKAYSDGDVAMQKAILPILHNAGLSQKQIDAIVPNWNGIADAAAKAQSDADTAAMTKAANDLKAELGTAYEERLALAGEALKHYSTELKLGDALSAELERTKLGNSPALAKLLAHLGSQLKEDGVLGKGGGNSGGTSPAEAKQQIAALQNDPAFMKQYSHKGIGHAEAVEKMKSLYQAAYPSAE
jgi:hypothetical protein